MKCRRAVRGAYRVKGIVAGQTATRCVRARIISLAGCISAWRSLAGDYHRKMLTFRFTAALIDDRGSPSCYFLAFDLLRAAVIPTREGIKGRRGITGLRILEIR